MSRMEMDWNLKRFGTFFQVLKLCLHKIVKKCYGLVSFDIFCRSIYLLSIYLFSKYLLSIYTMILSKWSAGIEMAK